MEQHKADPNRIVLPKVVMASSSEKGYHRFSCPGCDAANTVHEQRAINFNPEQGSHAGETLHFVCRKCKLEVHVSRCPVGGLIVL